LVIGLLMSVLLGASAEAAPRLSYERAFARAESWVAYPVLGCHRHSPRRFRCRSAALRSETPGLANSFECAIKVWLGRDERIYARLQNCWNLKPLPKSGRGYQSNP
jgi:hypothetical protein